MSTIAAICTPHAAGGVGIVRLSGENALQIASRCFHPVSGTPLYEMKGYRAAFGKLHDGDTYFDEGIAIVYRAPHSYTGEDVAELCCHGGLYVTRRLLRAVLSAGAQAAEAGEFTRRAFLNGRLDLAEAEAVMNIISAQGEQALRAAKETLAGSVSRAVGHIAATLTTAAAGIAAWTDYPDEDIPAVSGDALQKTLAASAEALQVLIRRYDSGRAVTEGVSTVICGKPNVGKSTLMNLLSGRTRSIVTPVAGTTRDVIEETVCVGDILLHLADTAGLRDTNDAVEGIGVQMAREKMETADLILAVFDCSQTLDDEDRGLLTFCKNRTAAAILNKSDLPAVLDEEEIRSCIPNLITLSAKNAQDGEALAALLAKALGTESFSAGGEVLACERQRQCCAAATLHLQAALAALGNGETLDAVGVCIDSALAELFTLTGQRVSDAVVSEVFSKFCVGK